jgi:hypothetical protein
MVYIGRFDSIPDYILETNYYRVEPAPDGRYDVHLDEPEAPLAAPVGEKAGKVEAQQRGRRPRPPSAALP